MLRTLNYKVASVASGEEAVAYLKEHEVDLIVLDMIMDPGMDGLDTYKQVLGEQKLGFIDILQRSSLLIAINN